MDKRRTSVRREDNDVMRVMHLLPHIKNVGNGIVNATVDLAAHQAESGMTVVIASRGGDYEPILHNANVLCEPLNLALTSFMDFRRLVKRCNPTIIHCHTPRAFLLAKSCFPFRRIVATAHNEFSNSTFLLILAKRIIAVSEHNGRAIGRWAGRSRVAVVKNGIIGGIRSRTEPRTPVIAMRHPSILFVGGMYERKGIADLLSAFKLAIENSSIKPTLYLVGAGPDQNRFEEIADSYELGDSAVFVGFIPNPTTLMSEADIFVLPSKEEPFGLVLAEARNAGCAIVGTSVGGIPELLENGRAGILVEPGDVDGLSSAIRTLITSDETRREWAEKSRMNTEWLSIQRVFTETSQVYLQVLDKKS